MEEHDGNDSISGEGNIFLYLIKLVPTISHVYFKIIPFCNTSDSKCR